MYRLLLVAGLLSLPMASAQAFDPYGGYFWQQPYGLRTDTFVPTPPYFSVFPPVYYGQRYARPYGISPFPASPHIGVPDSYRAAPRSAALPLPQVNPYCPTEVVPTGAVASPGDEAQGYKTAEAGPVIDNPHYKPATQFASDKSI